MRVICATAVVTLNAGSTGTITYPNAFPNACNAVVACNGDRNTTGGNVNIIGTSALGGFNFIAENSASSGVRINYIAVGY
ncbi:gp53-like domain-containing protein [Pantoea rodasii]